MNVTFFDTVMNDTETNDTEMNVSRFYAGARRFNTVCPKKIGEILNGTIFVRFQIGLKYYLI